MLSAARDVPCISVDV